MCPLTQKSLKNLPNRYNLQHMCRKMFIVVVFSGLKETRKNMPIFRG